jgi:hypothetical protein
MKEDQEDFTSCAALFADFIHHMKQTTHQHLPSAGITSEGGCGGGHGGRGARGRGSGSERCSVKGRCGPKGNMPDQADIDKVYCLQVNINTVKEYPNFIPAKKVWIHLSRSTEKSLAPSAKLLPSGGAQMTQMQ